MMKIGCCGFSTSQKRYWTLFSVLEIDSTFYQLPRLETAQRWRAEAPTHCEFTLKAWQLITHSSTSPTYHRLSEPIPERKKIRYGSFLNTPEVQEAWRRTLAIADALKATIILLECPSSFSPTADHVGNFCKFLRWAPRHGIRLAWEPRGHWPPTLIDRVCKDFDLIHTVDPLKNSKTNGLTNYFRLHGEYKDQRISAFHRYTDDELKIVRRACDKPMNYIFFNNINMLEDAQRFAQALLPDSRLARRLTARASE